MGLLYRAHVSGRFDLTRGDTRDRLWWIEAAWAVEYEARLAADELDRLTFHLHCAAVAAGDVDRGWKGALAWYDRLWARTVPWLPTPDRSDRPLRDLWVAHFGDPTSPETAAAVTRTVVALTGVKP